VRNLRVAGTGELSVGSRRELFTLARLPTADKVPILRAVPRKWAFEVNQFFKASAPTAPDAEIARIASGYPVFVIE
jgi:hypothetical protein